MYGMACVVWCNRQKCRADFRCQGKWSMWQPCRLLASPNAECSGYASCHVHIDDAAGTMQHIMLCMHARKAEQCAVSASLNRTNSPTGSRDTLTPDMLASSCTPCSVNHHDTACHAVRDLYQDWRTVQCSCGQGSSPAPVIRRVLWRAGACSGGLLAARLMRLRPRCAMQESSTRALAGGEGGQSCFTGSGAISTSAERDGTAFSAAQNKPVRVWQEVPQQYLSAHPSGYTPSGWESQHVSK